MLPLPLPTHTHTPELGWVWVVFLHRLYGLIKGYSAGHTIHMNKIHIGYQLSAPKSIQTIYEWFGILTFDSFNSPMALVRVKKVLLGPGYPAGYAIHSKKIHIGYQVSAPKSIQTIYKWFGIPTFNSFNSPIVLGRVKVEHIKVDTR